MTTPPKEKWRRLKMYGEESVAVPDRLFISDNEKTGCSLNVAMVGSCRPTSACYEDCYGLGGPVAFPYAVRRYGENLRRLAYLATAPQEEVDAEADCVAGFVAYHRQDFLRINGVGDLVSGTVRLVHALATRHPELQLWVSSRKPEMIAALPGRPNVHIMMSVDETTAKQDVGAFENLELVSNGQAFIAYTRRREDDHPPAFVSIVFEKHTGPKRAPWVPDARACAATIAPEHQGSVAHQAACGSCRRCFDPARRTA